MDKRALQRLCEALKSTKKNGEPTAATVRAAEQILILSRGEPEQPQIIRFVRADTIKR